MQTAWTENHHFRNIMMLLEVKETDISNIFHVLDSDLSGEVDYEEFCNQLYELRTSDVRTVMATTKSSLNSLEKGLKELVKDIQVQATFRCDHDQRLTTIDEKIDAILRASAGKPLGIIQSGLDCGAGVGSFEAALNVDRGGPIVSCV